MEARKDTEPQANTQKGKELLSYNEAKKKSYKLRFSNPGEHTSKNLEEPEENLPIFHQFFPPMASSQGNFALPDQPPFEQGSSLFTYSTQGSLPPSTTHFNAYTFLNNSIKSQPHQT